MNRALVLSAVVATLGCGSSSTGTSELGPKSTGEQCAVNRNDEVRQLLAPTCEGCHGAQSNRPFFASIGTFEDLLVYEKKYIVPGKPEESQLVKLLEAAGTGAVKQMPLVGESFAARSQKGATKITLTEIKQWIATLPPPGPKQSKPDFDAPTTRRLRAEEIVVTLRQILGLPEGGLLMMEGVDLLVRGADTAWGTEGYFSWLGDAIARFEALGGPNTLASRAREKNLTPATLQIVVQVSQDWCSRAVAQPGNKALFKYASPTSKADADAAAIKKNIGYLHLRFLGDVANDAAIDALFSNVYMKYESVGTDVAWTAVCADLVRHPQWLTF